MLESVFPQAVPVRRQGYEAVRHTIVARLAAGTFELPVLPDTARRAVVAASDPRSDAKVLSDIVRGDPAIAGHVLRVANSALYSPAMPIVSLQHAVARLGINALRDILMLVACSSQTVRGREAEVRTDFAHGVVSAAFAREIARRLRSNVESAFLAGLLQDVGRPVVRHAVLEVSRMIGTRCDRAEEDTLVDDLHADVGAALLRRWNLPAELEVVTRLHHVSPTESSLVTLASFADALARVAQGPRVAGVAFRLAGTVEAAVLGLYPEDVTELLAHADAIIAGARGVA